MKKIVIIDYGCGNLLNIYRAIEKIGYKAELTNKKEKIINATHLILPGVGAFGKAMEKLEEFDLKKAIKEFSLTNKPLLGICLGMQALFTKSFEFGINEGLNLIEGNVSKISSNDKKIKIPHIGWSEIYPQNLSEQAEKIFTNNLHGKSFYFVHSYIGVSSDPKKINAIAKYSNIQIPAFVSSNNIFGCQFL